MESNYEIIQKIEELYLKYGVDTLFLEALSYEEKNRGMKGVLAELELNKKAI